MGDLGEEVPEAPKIRTASWPVFCRKRAAIWRAGSVKLAATATCVCAACPLPTKPNQSSPKAATRDLSFDVPSRLTICVECLAQNSENCSPHMKTTVTEPYLRGSYFRSRSRLMRSSSLGGIALGAVAVALAGCATERAHAVISRPNVVSPASTTSQPFLRPYPEGQGDTDGLSRNPDDCDRGCIRWYSRPEKLKSENECRRSGRRSGCAGTHSLALRIHSTALCQRRG